MRTRRNHDSATDRSSLPSIQRLAAMTGVITACSVALAGACSDPDPNTSGAGATGLSGSGSGMGGNGGGDLSVVAGSVTVGSGSSVAASSSSGGGPKCPMGSPTGGATKFASAYGDMQPQTGSAVAYDKSGNILLAGSFSGSVNLGGMTLTSAGGSDVFVAKFSAGGQLMWAKSFGDAKNQSAAGIGVDANGNVYVTGIFLGSINFGGGNLTASGTLFQDVYLVKLGPDGTHVWSKSFGDTEVQSVLGLAVNAAGDVVIAGNFKSTINFGGALLDAGNSFLEAYVAKFTTAGVHLWSHQYGDKIDNQGARSVAITVTGDVIFSGEVNSTIDFGGGVLAATAKPGAFVAKLDTTGTYVWGKVSGGDAMGKATANTVTVAANGDVAVGGSFRGTFDLGGMPVMNPGTDDAYVTVLSSDGTHKLTKTFGDFESQEVTAVVFAPDNQVFVAGNYSGVIDLDSGDPRTSEGGFDGFLFRMDSKGCPAWLRTYPGPTAHTTKAIALDPSTSGVALTGTFNGTADFGLGVTTASGEDIFLMSVNP